MNVAQTVFKNQFLSTATGAAAVITSQAVRMDGNAAVLTVTLINVSGTVTITFILQGSYDGLAWTDIGTGVSPALTAFGVSTQSAASVNYAFLRVRASLSGTTVAILFDATVAMSAQ